MLGDQGPDIHRGTRQIDLPTRLDQTAGEHVTAILVLQSNLFDAILRAVKGSNRCDLNRREGAVIVVTLDPGKGGDETLIADHKADAPARHVVTLGHGEKLNRHVASTGNLHD